MFDIVFQKYYNGFYIDRSDGNHKLAISLPGIETETSINMFQTFPKFRKPKDSADRQFPCLGNDMETSTQVSQLSYMWDTKGIMTLIDSVCGNDWETTIVVSKHGKPLGNH